MRERSPRARVLRKDRELTEILSNLIADLERFESNVAKERVQVEASSTDDASSSVRLQNVGRTLAATISVLRKALLDLGKLQDTDADAVQERQAAAGVRRLSV